MPIEIYDGLKGQDENILKDIRKLVEKESPTLTKELVDQCGEEIQLLFKKYFNKAPKIYERTEYGNHLKYTFGEGEEQILISGHFDTVWPKGHLSYRVEENRAYGPGIIDMKGGLIIAIWALKTLLDLGVHFHKRIVFLCNSDHEGVASPDSRKIIEEEAQKSKAVLIPEAAEAGTNALKVERKGILRYTLYVKGKSAHSGNNHEEGVNAIVALAEIIKKIAEWTDYASGTTVNVGKMEGGTGVNVVPAKAQASVDIRVKTMEEANRMKKLMEELVIETEGAELEIQGGIVRPTLEQTPEAKKLYEIVKAYGDKFGYEVKAAKVGGGSDGSFASALGIPTLDGLGAAGAGPHAEHEHILINHLGVRTSLLAGLIYELTRE
ncbi:M20 family metallopeptidase [Oceanobacillus jeddahense]|uniref:M20 family metallopeptidase n=1 Tax=Oceanobacillus jeddahense TaxID=1462527 RepID=UPI000595AC02|nr:M20 family metallopeptidase [Oceanobacillus jeddahense]